MNNKIKAIGHDLVPVGKPLVTASVPEEPLPEVATPSLQTEEASLWQYPHLRNGLRNSLLPLQQNLDKFVSWQREKLQTAQELNFKEVVKTDPHIRETIKDLIPAFSNNNTDLMDVLRKKLIASADFGEKIIILKVFFSTENEDELFDSFLLPSLEKRQGFENLEANHEFCSHFLTSIDKKSLNKILANLDYGKITNTSILAKSLLTVSPPDQIFDLLMNVNEKLVSNNDDSHEHIKVIEKVQKLIIASMNCLQNEPGYVLAKHLKALYETAVKVELEREIVDLFNIHQPDTAVKTFKDVISQKDDTCESYRRKRFYAVEHYVKTEGMNAASELKKFLDEEEDSFIAGYMCYQLAKKCGADGKRTLQELIVKHIKQGKLSIPFGCTIQLAPYGDEYKKILENILCRYYKSDEGLKRAFVNLEAVDLCDISKSENGNMWFYTTIKENANLLIDFINQIGLKNLTEWAAGNKENRSPEKNFVKENSLEILDYAWQTQRGKITNLSLEIMPLGEEYNDLKSKSKQLVGMDLSGNGQIPGLKPFR